MNYLDVSAFSRDGLIEQLTFEGYTPEQAAHYLASLLIASGGDVKVVQARLRHASATTTLDTYAHLWPTATSPHEPPSERCWRLVRTRCGRARPRRAGSARQRPRGLRCR
jgi:hypothetical protein